MDTEGLGQHGDCGRGGVMGHAPIGVFASGPGQQISGCIQAVQTNACVFRWLGTFPGVVQSTT